MVLSVRKWPGSLLVLGGVISTALVAQTSETVVVRVNGEALFQLDVEGENNNLVLDYARTAAVIRDMTDDDARAVIALLKPTAVARLIDQILIAQDARALGIRLDETEWTEALQRAVANLGVRSREELEAALKRDGGSVAGIRRVWERSALIERALPSQVRSGDPAAFGQYLRKLRSKDIRLEWKSDDILRSLNGRGAWPFESSTAEVLAGNETVAIVTLRQVIRAQDEYSSACANGIFATTLDTLSSAAGVSAPFLDESLRVVDNRIERRGYVITLRPDAAPAQAGTCRGPAATTSKYTVFAVPTVPAVTGIRYFAATEGGTVFQNFTGPIVSIRNPVTPSSAKPIFGG